MEDLEKEKCSCTCCPECNCGEDCKCTEGDKCCEECTCDTSCNCSDKDSECHCDEKGESGENGGECGEKSCGCSGECHCGDNCQCDEHDKCCDSCTCGEQKAADTNGDCGCANKRETCDDDEDCKCNNACSADEDVADDECKCGCGEKVEEESTADAYFKQLLSLRAEFDNYRKRTQSDISKAYSNGFHEAVTQFIPALDSFKMATEYISDQNTLVGIQYIEKGILATLEKMGITVIDATGKFDPDFHQAIGSEVSAEHESGDIIKECFKGFKMGDKVIRYAQVIVCK